MVPTGGFGDNGRFIITKVVDENSDIKNVILTILKTVTFPCFVTIDGNGFLNKKEQDKEEIVFCFASINTGIELANGKNVQLIDGKQTRKALENYIEKLSDEEFLDSWFRQHDRVADFRGSGYGPRRLINLVITLDPMYLSVTKIMQ